MLSLRSCHLVTKDGLVSNLASEIRGSEFGQQQAVPFIKGKKNTKTMSQAAGFALAALEAVSSDEEDWRKGLFLSAPAPAASDKSGFERALKNREGSNLGNLAANLDQGIPVTGLIGLPNGVMCFGAKATGAFGPNTVAVNEGVGTHQALAAALRHQRAGTIDWAVVCGFSQPNLPANRCLYECLELVAPSTSDQSQSWRLTDSAVSCEFAAEPGVVEVHDAFLFTDTNQVIDRLARLGWKTTDISFVMQPSMPESAAVETNDIFSEPVLQWSGYEIWGFQAEAAGLLELGLLYQRTIEGGVLDTPQGSIRLDTEQKFLLFGRSAFGQMSCVVGRVKP